MTEGSYKMFNHIDLRQFYLDTSPRYYLFNCQLLTIDCRHHWDIVRTSLGSCLSLKPHLLYEKAKEQDNERRRRNHNQHKNGTVLHALSLFNTIPPPSKFKQLHVTIGYNKSDATFGWNGFNNGLVMYYMDTDETYPSARHSVALVPGLSPTIVFSRSETRLLGKPFTECNSAPNYEQRTCQVERFMRKLVQKCNCFPSHKGVKSVIVSRSFSILFNTVTTIITSILPTSIDRVTILSSLHVSPHCATTLTKPTTQPSACPLVIIGQFIWREPVYDIQLFW